MKTRRRVAPFTIAAALAFSLTACKQHQAKPGVAAGQPTARMASLVQMGDAHAAGQLVSGFYGIEGNAWRWTGKQFALELGTPAGAAQNGAVLQVKLTVPPVTVEKLRSVTLSASTNGTSLAPETYTKPGQYTYRRDVPGSALTGDATRISFQLDKAMPPAGGDVRELGIIVSSAELSLK